MRQRNLVVGLYGAGLILCLLLCGCGGRGIQRGEGQVDAPYSRAAAFLGLRGTRPVIKIGLVAPFEGRYRSLGYEVLHAVKLAVRERNAAGGVAGYMIELVALDDNDDPGASAFQAKKFAVDERVMGVVGPFSDLCVQAVAPVYHNLGLPVITPASCPRSTAYNEVYCLGADADTLARALVERVPAGARVTLIHGGEASAPDKASAQGEALAGVAQSAAQQVLTPPWNEVMLEVMRDTPADVYLYDGDVLEAADLLIEMRKAGIDAPFWGGPALARTQLSQIAGEASAGACHALTDPLLADLPLADSPMAGLAPGSEFANAYQELAGTAPGPWAALAYDASVLLLDALQRAIEAQGWPTREGVAAALVDARGPDGGLVFDQGRRSQAEVTLYCYQGGDNYPGSLRR
jgi:branched-chain amino acid transport system substrate-binding protein